MPCVTWLSAWSCWAEHPPAQPPLLPGLRSRNTPVLLGKSQLCISHPVQEIQPVLVCHNHSKAAFHPAGQAWKNIIYNIQTILEKNTNWSALLSASNAATVFFVFVSQSGNAGDGYKRQMCPAVMLAPLQQERGSGQEWKRDKISQARKACFQPLQDIFLMKSPTLTHSMNHMNTRLHLFLY